MTSNFLPCHHQPQTPTCGMEPPTLGAGRGGGGVFLPQLKLSSNTFTDKPWCIYLQVIPALLRQTVEIHHHKFPFLGIGDSWLLLAFLRTAILIGVRFHVVV